ncbi:hypothetical protein FRC11_008763, partial [Ceratobasidium sp. 423]
MPECAPPPSEPPGPEPQAPISGSNLQSPPDPVWSEDGHTVTDANGRKYSRISSIDDDEISPAVQALPSSCSGSRKRYWNPWCGDFLAKKVGSRGSGGENGRNWVFGKFVTHYCDKFHPQLTPEERCQYEALIGQNIYYRLYNSYKRKTIPAAGDTDDSDDELVGYKGPSRVSAEYLWEKEKKEAVKELLENYFTNHPNIKRTAGQRHTAILKLYKSEVSKEDKARYKAMVDEENQNIRAGIRLEGEALLRFHKRLPGTLQKSINTAYSVGGVHIILTMVMESAENPGELDIYALSSQDLKAFRKDKSVGKAMTSMREFVRQSKGGNANGVCGPPPPEIYPNRRGAGEPLVPNPEGLRAFELISLHRNFWKLFWAFMGGDCRFPWAEISKNPLFWLGVGPEELPGPMRDPSSLGGAVNKAWLLFFFGHQTGTDLASQPVFLRRVLAANPINPSESEEVSRERYTYNGQEVWLLTFDKPVTKCHARKMEWSPTSIEYADYVETGRTTASVMASNPLALPIAPKSQMNKVLIDGEMLEYILSHTNQLPDDAETKSAVLDLVHAYNDFAAHLPAETERGAWSGTTPPLILPQKPTPIFNILAKHLLPPSFFQSMLKAIKEGTLPYLEEWIELILAAKLLSHDKSSTLLGGGTGVIWAAVALILLIFNFNYVRGDVPLPVQLPEGYDLSRLPTTECERAVGWCRALTKKLGESQAILSQSSPQRLRTAPTATGSSTKPSAREDTSGGTSQPQPPDAIPPPASSPKPTSTPKRSKRARAQKSVAKEKVAGKKVAGKKAAHKPAVGRKPRTKRKGGSESEGPAEFTDEDADEEEHEEEFEEDSSGSDASQDEP